MAETWLHLGNSSELDCTRFALSMQRNLNIYNMGYLKRIDFLSQIVIGSLTVLSPFVHGPLLEIRKNQEKTKK